MKTLGSQTRVSTRLSVLLVALMVFGAACSGGSDSDANDTSTTPAAAPTATTVAAEVPGATPQPTLREAVEALLKAEQANDHDSSYKLLDAEGHTKFTDASDWAERRTQTSPITGFTIDDSASNDQSIVAIVEHEPGLDPFVGLSAAKEKQSWVGSKTPSGFLVSPEPTIEFILPSEAGVAEQVQEWIAAVQACDEGKAMKLQAVEILFGASSQATKLCNSTTPAQIGSVKPLGPGPASADLVAQFSSDVLTWARTVRVTGPAEFTVVVAPIGDSWQVLSLND